MYMHKSLDDRICMGRETTCNSSKMFRLVHIIPKHIYCYVYRQKPSLKGQRHIKQFTCASDRCHVMYAAKLQHRHLTRIVQNIHFNQSI